MSTPGQPTENAFAESFAEDRKVGRSVSAPVSDLRGGTSKLADVSGRRLHSSLDYVPPDEFELKYAMC